jgi:hypothetical protein
MDSDTGRIPIPDGRVLRNGATQEANAVVMKSQEAAVLIDTLKGWLPDEEPDR